MRPERSVPAPPPGEPTAAGSTVPGSRAQRLGLAFRSISDADLAFLADLYASTREAELAPVPWTDAEKRAFLRQQFEAQHAHYTMHYGEADFLVVEKDGEAVGRLYLARWTREHRVIDIALVPQWRNRGVGAAIMQDLCDEAGRAGKPVTIHVEAFNPALSLYRRLGFTLVEDKGVYLLMEWRAALR